MIIFVKPKDFTEVVRKIAATVAAHPNVKRSIEYPKEKGFRFVLRHREDAERELTLTVLAFHVPVVPEDDAQQLPGSG